MPSAAQVLSAISPKESRPSLAMKLTSPPARAAATDWFEPLPPGPMAKPWPSRVSPITGRRLARKREVRHEDSENGNAWAAHGASGGMTPFLKTKQP